MDSFSEELQNFLILLGQHPEEVSEKKAHYMVHLLQLLPAPEEAAIKQYYGLYGQQVRSLCDLAAMFHTSQQAMQTIIEQDLRRIAVTPEWQMIKGMK